MHPLPAAIDDLRLALSDIRPGAVIKAEAPFHASDTWWLDVDGLPFVYRPRSGFGFFAPEADEPSLWILQPAEAAHEVAARMPCRIAA